MAEKLGFLNQWLWGNWAERETINRNAESLSSVEASVADLRLVVQAQQKEILQLRALLTGIVEVVQPKAAFTDAELETAVRRAWDKLAPPPPTTTTDPYRGTPGGGEPSAEDVAAAKALLATAQDHHFGKRFAEARQVYQEIVDKYRDTKHAATARQQLANLKMA